jgi:pyrroline-5-carboxylate reductase
MVELSEQIREALTDVAVAGVGLAGAYAVYLFHQLTRNIKEKTSLIKEQKKAAIINWAMDQVDEMATKAVEKFEQTVAAELRKKVKAGEANRSGLLELGNKAVNEVMATLAPEALRVLRECLGDYRAYIENTVESKVRQVKQEERVSA